MWHRRIRSGRGIPRALNNVIELNAFRKRTEERRYVLFYLNSSGYFRNDVLELTQGSVIEIQSPEALASALLLYRPDSIIVEPSLSWADPYGLVSHLTQNHRAPIIMLFEPTPPERADENIRNAYCCGVSDTLFAPLCNQELLTSLKILLGVTEDPFAFKRRL